MKVKLIILFISIQLYINPSYGSNLTFNWDSSKANVTETISKNDNIIKIQYQIELLSQEDFFIFKQSNIEVLWLNFEENVDQKIKNYLAKVLSIPSFKINKKGEFLEVINFEKYLDKFISVMDEKEAKFYMKLQMQNLLMQNATDKWCYWVCTWIDERVKESHPLKETVEVDFMGQKLPIVTTITHHGFTDDEKTYVKLSFLSKIGGSELVNAVKDLSTDLGMNDKPKSEDLDSAKISKITTINTIINPKNLKPVNVEVKKVSTVTIEGKEQSKTEYIKFQFEWIN